MCHFKPLLHLGYFAVRSIAAAQCQQERRVICLSCKSKALSSIYRNSASIVNKSRLDFVDKKQTLLMLASVTFKKRYTMFCCCSCKKLKETFELTEKTILFT